MQPTGVYEWIALTHHVCGQIVRNALQYGVRPKQTGLFVFSVLAEREGEAVRVSFADSGIGIPKRDLRRVFEPFYTGSNGPTPSTVRHPAAASESRVTLRRMWPSTTSGCRDHLRHLEQPEPDGSGPTMQALARSRPSLLGRRIFLYTNAFALGATRRSRTRSTPPFWVREGAFLAMTRQCAGEFCPLFEQPL